MKALTYRSSPPTTQITLSDRAFMEAQRRLVGVRVQADVPTGKAAGYRRGIIARITPDRQALIECDGAWGTVWVSLDVVAALEAY